MALVGAGRRPARCVLVLGIPCMISEFIIGRHGASNTFRAYAKVSDGSAWKYVGLLGVLTGFLITGYYAVVSGWCLQYGAASVLNTGSIFCAIAIPPQRAKRTKSERNLLMK